MLRLTRPLTPTTTDPLLCAQPPTASRAELRTRWVVHVIFHTLTHTDTRVCNMSVRFGQATHALGLGKPMDNSTSRLEPHFTEPARFCRSLRGRILLYRSSLAAMVQRVARAPTATVQAPERPPASPSHPAGPHEWRRERLRAAESGRGRAPLLRPLEEQRMRSTGLYWFTEPQHGYTCRSGLRGSC